MITIKEVICRSDQGVTHPFVCRDENGNQLWVKGAAWLAKDLIAEWICARIAKEWGLPVEWFDDVRPNSLQEELERIGSVLRRIESDPKSFWKVSI